MIIRVTIITMSISEILKLCRMITVMRTTMLQKVKITVMRMPRDKIMVMHTVTAMPGTMDTMVTIADPVPIRLNRKLKALGRRKKLG